MNEYEIKEIPSDIFDKLWLTHSRKFFEEESQIFRLRNHLSEQDKENSERLKQELGNPIRINLGVFYQGQFVGWSWGFQESPYKFYMCNSAIFPEHRRKGLYTELIKEMLKRIKSLGFQEVYSRHTAGNNAVIIPKLKAGFSISSMEISDLFGTLIHLTYYLIPLRKKVYDYRTGQIKPDNELSTVLGIKLQDD